jgi:hypothetical protein
MDSARTLQLFILFCICSLTRAYALDSSCAIFESRVDAGVLEAIQMAALAAEKLAQVPQPGAPRDIDISKEQLWYGFEEADFLDLKSIRHPQSIIQRRVEAGPNFLQSTTKRLVSCLF